MHQDSSSPSRNRARVLRALAAGQLFETLESRQLLSSPGVDGVLALDTQAPIVQATGTGPIIGVTGNSVTITSGDTTPQRSDFTDFGPMSVASGSVTRQFTIKNIGDAALNLTNLPLIQITGANASDFTLWTSPATSVAAAGTTTFTLSFNPSAAGERKATVTIASNDLATPAFTFDVSGTGLVTTDQPNGLKTFITTAGTGTVPVQNGYFLTMNYTGYLLDGTKFDSSLNPGRSPFTFTIGTGAVIAGWDQGILGMTANESRVLIIPSTLGYGTAGSGSSIPPNATLIFEVTLLTIATPTITVSGKGVSIPSGEAAPATTNDTDLGSLPAGSSAGTTHTFSITNTGGASTRLSFLHIPGIELGGTNAADFSATQVSIANNVATFTVSFKPLLDSIGDRTATITIQTNDPVNSSFTFMVKGTATAAIVPDVSIADASVLEGDGGSAAKNNEDFVVTLSQVPVSTVTVKYTTSNGTTPVGGATLGAKAGVDFVTTTGTLTFAPGQTTGHILVPIIGNTKVQVDKTFSVTLSDATNSTITTATAKGTIVDDDSLPIVTVTSAGVPTENQPGSAGKTTITFTRSIITSAALTVNLTTTGSAISGTDYTALPTSVTIPAGKASVTIPFATIADNLAEGAENVIVTVTAHASYKTNATKSTKTLTITDNAPTVSIVKIKDASENNATTTGVGQFRVSLNHVMDHDVVVDYNATGSAISGTDYLALTGSATIPAGKLSQTISLTPVDDAITEGSENVILTLVQDGGPSYFLPTNATAKTATLTIADYEVAPQSVAGRTFTATIQTGTGIFATSGTFQLIFSSTGNQYMIVGSATAASSSGTYTYARTGSKVGHLVLTDATAGTFDETLTFTSATAAMFSVTKGSDTQTGTMTLRPAAKATAPASVQGHILNINITAGSGVLAAQGSFKIAFAATGNTYVLTAGPALASSTGTYTYELFAPNVGLLTYQDALSGSGWASVVFNTVSSGSYVYTSLSLTGSQRGTVTLR